jgi:glycosyltransferase involved in cell wall biosynthesis
MIRWTLQHAAGGVGVCEALKEAMLKLGSASESTRAIGNGVDLKRFSPVDRGVARRRLGIPEDAEVIVSVGNLVPVKGHQFLIPAIAELASRHPRIRLYVVGEGYSRSKLEELARQRNIQNSIVFLGRKPNEELKDWYSAADVSCLTSSREGWANVLLESLACGTPVVATRVWGAPEVINSPELGILVDQSISSITEGIDAALQKHWDREALVSYAASRTWDVVAEEIENFLSVRIAAGRGLSSEASEAH